MNALYAYDESVCLLVGLILGVVIAVTLLRETIDLLKVALNNALDRIDDLDEECDKLASVAHASVRPIRKSHSLGGTP